MDEKNFEFLMYSSADEEVSVNALVKDEYIFAFEKYLCRGRIVRKSNCRGNLGSSN